MTSEQIAVSDDARTIAVDGFGQLNVFYVHQRSAAKGAITLLSVHGSVSADRPTLSHQKTSLPGFAWLEGVLEKGFHVGHFTELTLTTVSKYGPKHIKASHSYMPMRQFAAHNENFFKNGRGYSAEQSTKPQTLGVSLADSPVGRIYEKLVTWTDAYPWTDDEASIRIFYELALAGQVEAPVPDWRRYPNPPIRGQKRNLAPFPSFARRPSQSACPTSLRTSFSSLGWLRAQAIIMFESEYEVGGHFAAFEQPSAFVGDLRKMFGKSGPAAGVVLGCASY
ncbi:alpha/beta-hydrolase [Lactarius hatsudake]|nr:alpha/beta-hydrolase [Lactarius hatsudake]